jgi:putative NADH-flavin reductase
MHILLLGASGGCGQWVARLARERGHRITAVVREGAGSLTPDCGATVIGDVVDSAVLSGVLAQDVNAIVSCLGIRRRNPRNPWSPVQGTHKVVGPVATALQHLLPMSAVRRVITVSSAGVADSAVHTNPLLRWVFANSNVRIAFDDLAAMERILGEGNLDWMAVRPTRLVDGPPTGRAHVCERFRLGSSISRGDVASWLLDAAEATAPITRRTPMITTT